MLLSPLLDIAHSFILACGRFCSSFVLSFDVSNLFLFCLSLSISLFAVLLVFYVLGSTARAFQHGLEVPVLFVGGGITTFMLVVSIGHVPTLKAISLHCDPATIKFIDASRLLISGEGRETGV